MRVLEGYDSVIDPQNPNQQGGCVKIATMVQGAQNLSLREVPIINRALTERTKQLIREMRTALPHHFRGKITSEHLFDLVTGQDTIIEIGRAKPGLPTKERRRCLNQARKDPHYLELIRTWATPFGLKHLVEYGPVTGSIRAIFKVD